MSGGKLPEGWTTAPVSTVTTLIRGVTYKKEQALNYLQDDYLPLIRANNIQNGKFDTTDLVFVPKNLVKESQKISPEDIVIAMSSGSKSVVGKSAHQRLPFECSFGAFCGALRPEKHISPSFIAHFTKSSFYRNKISSLSAGANINNIKPASFDLINIPIPSLAEQKIIAEKLDTLLAQVDSTKARLEQIPQILKRFRQAVLAAAVTGRLTKEYNDCTKKTIELENYKISIPKKWNETILNNVINTQRPLCYGVVQPGDDINDGIELIRVCDINDGEVDLNHLRRISKEIDIQYKRSKVQKNDILITIVGAIGRIGIVRENINVNIARAVARVSPESKFIIPMFLHIWLSSPIMQTWLVQSSKEVARKTLNLKDLKEAFVPLPSIEEQHEIVRRVEQLFAWADTIEKQVNNALTRVNSLTQSILAKAFRGELTAQWRAENPDLISGENSAAALLEKIKAERAASGGKKTSRKKA
ncbi:restriction endonuclease subunit S [Salmonella enterica subsp. enterica serovar Molade]|nr:restriction endonuclease subunit S [Salmonella enterica]EAA8090726.1 restriction endonuclease subunit S [Salmonella enterica subsp. enterica serovar Molade]EDR0012909.1 restriction endonuclease subunit S [Salmonella enterica subsp. enterica]EAA9800196.1 restriction endonuclease subunit S [Salmonella enterica subsp. enterica serovar Molade]EBY1540208.1 restriction endonuclease subunit S [Salmonella enterica subsp. enterica serovar Molade]